MPTYIQTGGDLQAQQCAIIPSAAYLRSNIQFALCAACVVRRAHNLGANKILFSKPLQLFIHMFMVSAWTLKWHNNILGNYFKIQQGFIVIPAIDTVHGAMK